MVTGVYAILGQNYVADTTLYGHNSHGHTIHMGTQGRGWLCWDAQGMFLRMHGRQKDFHRNELLSGARTLSMRCCSGTLSMRCCFGTAPRRRSTSTREKLVTGKALLSTMLPQEHALGVPALPVHMRHLRASRFILYHTVPCHKVPSAARTAV